jgi:MFS family permease
MAVAFGPVVGGFMLKHFWWGSVFLVNLPIVAISLVVGARLIPDSRNPEAHKLDKVGFLLSVVAVSSVVYTVIESPHWGWGSAKSNLGFGIAVFTLIGFVIFESKKENPLLEVTFFKNARFSAATGSIGIAFFCLFGFTFLVTQYFQFVRGYDTLSAGVHTIPFAVGAGVTAPLAARAALKFGTKRVVALGLFNMSLGLLIASRMDAHSSYWGHVIIGMVLMANGLSFVTSPSTDAVMGSLPREKAGVGSAVNDISREVGGTLGVAVVGSVFVSLYTPRLVSNFAKIPGLVDALNKISPHLYPMAQESVGAAFGIAQKAPDQVKTQVLTAVSDSFVHGFQTACLVGVGMAFIGSLFALKFLPARAASND